MTTLQFRVLYREFLFRMVDLEVLSTHAKGDISRLFGQFAALLVFLSLLFAISAMGMDSRMPVAELLNFAWSMEHVLISTTMLVVGLFAVLSWDSTFPDRRDVLVLAPLPVRARTLFLARVAALATALCLTVTMLNSLTGLTWPVALIPANGGVLGLIRSFVAYWMTMLAAGSFILCCVLMVQGLAAQLPRRHFLRLSAFLQMGAFCLFLSVYFLQPSLTTPEALTAVQNQRLLAWLPSYWFLGLFQMLNGSVHPALVPLARRGWTGLAVASCGAGIAFLLSYFRTLRKIVEEPDIVPGSHGLHWSPRFGNGLKAAIVLFSVRSLLRSRQHRLLLAFYLGIGFTFVVLFMETPRAQQQLSADTAPLLFSSLVMMCACVAGTRVVFAMPLNLGANWIFRLTEVRGPQEYLAAIRRPLFVLGAAPAWVASAAVLLSIWAWRPAGGHILILGLWGMILSYVCLLGFRKFPFACSYLPGKSYVHMVFLAALGLMFVILKITEVERRALQNPGSYAWMVIILAITAVCIRWLMIALANSEDAALQFEAEPPGEVLVLGLHS